MLTKEVYEQSRLRAINYLERAGIVITDTEKNDIQVAEYNMNDIDNIGLELVVYVNTQRCCAKELVLFPGQTCPEHRHPPVNAEPGKEETFRCRYGEVYLYLPAENSAALPQGSVPAGYEDFFTCTKRIVLRPGEQYTIPPDTLHWFRSGPDGAVVSEFSTQSRDEFDIYTDPRISASQARQV
jgi:D-lyxose ketol-isomerase